MGERKDVPSENDGEGKRILPAPSRKISGVNRFHKDLLSLRRNTCTEDNCVMGKIWGMSPVCSEADVTVRKKIHTNSKPFSPWNSTLFDFRFLYSYFIPFNFLIIVYIIQNTR